MGSKQSSSKELHVKNEILPKIETASSGSIENRVGIERAFEVIRHHTVHTKGYVLTALQLIEEFGSASDKALLAELLREKGQSVGLTGTPAPKKSAPKRR
jgi:hypothetical protein